MKRTQKQIDASRRNGALSKGPITAAGKDRSSRGALKHGFRSAKHFVLDNEDPREYEALIQGMVDSLNPVNTLEESLVLQIATAQWRLQRHTGLEAGLLKRAVEMFVDYRDPEDVAQDPHLLQAQVFRDYSNEGDFALNLRYQSQASRDFHRALKTLLALRKPPNEPKTAPTPQPSTTSKLPNPPAGAAEPPATPRNASCPCRSGLKFKRCCGKNAPPHLSKGAHAA